MIRVVEAGEEYLAFEKRTGVRGCLYNQRINTVCSQLCAARIGPDRRIKIVILWSSRCTDAGKSAYRGAGASAAARHLESRGKPVVLRLVFVVGVGSFANPATAFRAQRRDS
jgi:hypothetical protein